MPLNLNLERSRIALHSLRHRGPDQFSDWQDEFIYLGHQRLSILDLSTAGRQPMTNEDETIVMTVNGEIYNYLDLKSDLHRRYSFKSNSDSEILVHGYDAWGIQGLLNRIEGMFALTIYDARNKKLFLARDRVGIKPLFYACMNTEIVWASELKAIEILLDPQKLRLDPEALYDFVSYLYIPTPKTMYRDVHKLEPAHFLEVDLSSKNFKKMAYWTLPVRVVPISDQDAKHQTRELMRQAVRRQLMSDVPLGLFLSGGMDSSTVVCEANQLMTQLHTYTIGFDAKYHDETHYAQMVANHFGTIHASEVLQERRAEELFYKLRQWFDEPFADTSALATYFVCQLARRDSKVVLTGDGGDEIFGGYNWYFRFQKYDRNKWPSFIDPFRASIVKATSKLGPFHNILQRLQPYSLTDDLELYAYLRGRPLKAEKRVCAKYFEIPDDYDDYWHYRKFYHENLPLLTRLQYLDFHSYLPDQLLTKVDRVSMAVSLEARVPLLSTSLIEFFFSLPESLRFRNGQLKGLLKFAYQEDLPAQILQRGKKGFSIPPGTWNREFQHNRIARQMRILGDLFDIKLSTGRKETWS